MHIPAHIADIGTVLKYAAPQRKSGAGDALTGILFPRATSQAAALVRIFGGCREGQYPAACSGVVD